ncbi:MAG: NAD(P)H-hydrate dehydratase [Tannerellaceae bacterium]|jgi:NAD(P)H-hydrate epimerase|nr:NAD(P)H-hydrate dehydratase [Tannerellaceae bacterium]
MIKILSSKDIKALEALTVQKEPVNAEDLVERAAKAFTAVFARRFPATKRVVVFAGQGGNGADALAIARLLIERYSFIRVETFFFNAPSGHISETCDVHRGRLKAVRGVVFTEVRSHFNPPALKKDDIVIDGLFGIGLNRELSGGFAGVAGYINSSSATVVAVDIPSGLPADGGWGGTASSFIIRAAVTISFAFPKLSFMMAGSYPFVGEWEVVDIGLDRKSVDEMAASSYLLEAADVTCRLPARRKSDHKGIFGHALLVAGSRQMGGAAILAAGGCMRAGAGKLTVHTTASCAAALLSRVPEAMVSVDGDAPHITYAPAADGYNAVAVGPGLGLHPGTAAAVRWLLGSVNCPVVVDGDALNMVAGDKNMLSLMPKGSILTPHIKEFDRIAGESASDSERLTKAKALAGRHSLVIVLKGANTAICAPSGDTFFNNTGNPGLATAGSGDVLTGIILGLLAAGCTPLDAAICGAYIHGLAADISLRSQSAESLLAGDIVTNTGAALRRLHAGKQ